MTILWRDSMRIGDEQIDADHKKFIALLNLTERSLQQRDVAPATEIFEEVLSLVEEHFPAEEAYMRRIGFPGLEENRREHEALAHRFYVLLGRFRAALTDGERRRHVAKLAELLREWLIDHILKEIIALKPFLQPPPPPPQPTPPPQATPWLAPPGGSLWLTPAQAAAPAVSQPPAPEPAIAPPPEPTSPPAGGEWRLIDIVPVQLQKYLAPLDYATPRPPPPQGNFPSFQALCEAAVWRSVHKVLLFFQRHNSAIVRELPPLFVASPEFARNFRRALDAFIFPAMWETRRMRMLLTNFTQGMADDETLFPRMGERNTGHVLSVWAQSWNALRLIEGPREAGFNIVKIKEDTKKIREMLQPSTPLAYDLPKVGNREIEIFKALLDPANDWPVKLERHWRKLQHYYLQEKSPLGDPEIREGTLRDKLIEMFNDLPEPWGDFMLLTAHRVFPRLDSGFLENFSTNFGRSEAAREAVMPYTMRYLRQARADQEIRTREAQEEEEWQNAIAELGKYRKWRAFGEFM